MCVQLDYNKNGQEVLRKFGNGTTEESLYDKAARVTVKMQKTERCELLWGEGYLYGSDGKRTATVDNLGQVTLYEYNKKGQLENVYYPYTQELVNNLKKEAEENGLAATADVGENRYLTSSEKASLTQLLNSMQYGLAYNLTNLQVIVKESYSYDKNGNRTGKTTKYGTINYSYDKENRLVSSGSRGRAFINYTYDNAGNLLTEESSFKSTKYAYNALNRLIYCEVTDKTEKTYAQTVYAYDAFGRRVIVQDKGEAAVRTLYDGFTFDVIKQSSTLANGLFTDSNNTGIRWSPTGKPTGDRYRYISDEDAQDDNRYFYLDENIYKTVNSRYRGERTQIIVNGSLAAQASSEGEQYFTTDLSGSVSSVTDSYGYQLGEYTYDAFGSLVQGDLSGVTDFGYLGKQSDPTSKLYNYGYRDYAPQFARFTTVDPIRDGANWFAYVNNDPVNFVDLWGLEQTKYQKEISRALAQQALYDIDLQNYIKQNTVIEVTRSELDDGDKGKDATYFQSTVSVKVGNLVLNESKIQSTPDHPNLNNGDPDNEGGTLAPGEYVGTLINQSHSYYKAISITGNGVTREESVLFHPNAMTALGSREPYGQGELKGRPLSLACQIQQLESHEEMTDILESLGFRFGDGKTIDEWVDGDKIKVIIKDSKCSK